MISPILYVLVSAVVAGVGVYGVISQRGAIRMLIAIELMFNSALLLLLTFSRFVNPLEGSVLALFAITLASAEVGVVVPIIVLLFRVFGTTDVTKASKMKR